MDGQPELATAHRGVGRCATHTARYGEQSFTTAGNSLAADSHSNYQVSSNAGRPGFGRAEAMLSQANAQTISSMPMAKADTDTPLNLSLMSIYLDRPPLALPERSPNELNSYLPDYKPREAFAARLKQRMTSTALKNY